MMSLGKRWRGRRATVAGQVAITASLLLLAGCGGSSSSHTGQTRASAHTSAPVMNQTQPTSTPASPPTIRSHHPARAAHASKASPAKAAGQPHATTQPAPASTTTHPAAPTPTTTPAPPVSHPQPAAQPATQPQHHQPRPQPPPAPSHAPSRSASTASPTTAFKSAYRHAIGPLKQSAQDIGAALRTAANHTYDENLHTFRALSGSWRSELSTLLTLRAPTKVAPEFSALTGAGKRVKVDLHEIVSAMSARNLSSAGQILSGIVSDLITAKTADTALQQRLGSG